MIDNTVWRGVNFFLDDYVEIRRDDTVILLYTPDSYEPAGWVSAALSMRSINVSKVCMAPLRDTTIRDKLLSVVPAPASLLGRLVILTFELDTMSHTGLLRSIQCQYPPESFVLFRVISAGPDLFSYGLRVTPSQLSARNTAILKRCLSAKSLHIRSCSGTDLRIVLDNERHRWISNRGVWRPGSCVILPAGEVATYPAHIEGTFVANFAFNINASTELDVRLTDNPITVSIEDGHAVNYTCANEDIYRLVRNCFQTASNARRVGELGFGTNFGVDWPIAMNSHINERKPGVHLGFGQHNQDESVVPYYCNVHLDLIANGGLVWIDGDPVPIDLENVTPSDDEHPTIACDEDVFSPDKLDLDCCGMLKNQGLQLTRG